MPLICAHIPCNYLSESFLRLLRSLEWTDECVLHDASPGNSLADAAKKVRPNIQIVKDLDPDIRSRLFRNKDIVQSEFILWAQADEEWPPELGNTIKSTLLKDPSINGLIVPHASINFGGNFGIGWPQLRVFRRDSFRFETESNIHEMPKVDGKTKVIDNHYFHFANQNLLLFFIKNYKYEVISAARSPSLDSKCFLKPQVPLLSAFIYWCKVSKVFFITLYIYRKHGLAGFLYANSMALRKIEQVCVSAEVTNFKSYQMQYQMLGHAEMPLI